jgi:hypothetical protein
MQLGSLIPTTTMERLPAELVIQILSYLYKEELKTIGFISSEYRSLVMPFLFHRIRPWWWRAREQDISDLIACLQNNSRLSSVVRVLGADAIGKSLRPVEELRQIMEITARWEGLILPADEHIPLSLFDDNMKLQLRHLKFTSGTTSARQKLSDFLLNILPACTNLVTLEINGVEEDWFKTCDPTGSTAAIWMSRLEKYRGPSYFLNYLHNLTPLHQLISTTVAPSPVLQRLGRLVGQQLLTLHVEFSLLNFILIRNPNSSFIGEGYLPPSLFPSSFPNLRYVSWFLILTPGDPVRTFLALCLLLIAHIRVSLKPTYSVTRPLRM